MTKFVYVSDDYRRAWHDYILNPFKNSFWPVFEDDFKTEFEFKLEEEKYFLNKYARPPSWYLNDFMGENYLLFNMSSVHFNGSGQVKYEYDDTIGTESSSLKDILLSRAEKISKMNKKIEIFYSGGIDSVATLLAFIEVCPKDQIKVWMSGEQCIHNYPELYKKHFAQIDYEFTDDLVGCADPSQNVYCTGQESDRLFGADGYTVMMQFAHRDKEDEDKYVIDFNKAPTTDAPENNDWNHSRWWGITRHTYLTQAFRLLQNIKCDKIDLSNYQPLFFDHDVLKFAINLHIEKKHKWFNSGGKADPERYRLGKMWVRDFIYSMNGDKDYAYGRGKTFSSPLEISSKLLKPLPTAHNVLAITDTGDIINRENIMHYLKREELTI